MNKIMRSAILALAAIAVGVASAETVVSAETEPFRLSIKHDGVRVSGGEETLTYGARWHGGEGATVTLTQDGTELVTGLTGEGTNLWSVSRNGTYVLTHQTIENGDATSTLTATFVVSGREIPVGELTIDWGESTFVYDGQPKEPVVTVSVGEEILTNGTNYLVQYLDNVNVGTAKTIVKGIEPFSGVVTNTFTIAAGDIGGGGGEEPGTGVIPEGGISKYDATYVYDGEGHTINTQALYAVTLTGSTPSFSFSLDGETRWQNDPFVYTNVGEYVMWYKISAQNYNDYKHQAKLRIVEPSSVTVRSVRQRYPWNGLVDVDIDLKGDGRQNYAVAIIARDIDGGTNLPTRTVSCPLSGRDPVMTDDKAVFVILPGVYRMTWDAHADIVYDHNFPHVSIAVTAVPEEAK